MTTYPTATSNDLHQIRLTKWHAMLMAATAKIEAANTQAELDAAQDERDHVLAIKPTSLQITNEDLRAFRRS